MLYEVVLQAVLLTPVGEPCVLSRHPTCIAIWRIMITLVSSSGSTVASLPSRITCRFSKSFGIPESISHDKLGSTGVCCSWKLFWQRFLLLGMLAVLPSPLWEAIMTVATPHSKKMGPGLDACMIVSSFQVMVPGFGCGYSQTRWFWREFSPGRGYSSYCINIIHSTSFLVADDLSPQRTHNLYDCLMSWFPNYLTSMRTLFTHLLLSMSVQF